MNLNLIQKWYVAQIKPNAYDLAIRNLERQGFETFLPTNEITIKKQNKFVIKNVFVFPGYLFVGFDPNLITWTKINSTYGVSKILAFNNKPSEISRNLILTLKKRYQVNTNPRLKKNLEKGDTLKFLNGPFADLIGMVESTDEKKRIWVLLEAMGGYQKLKVKNLDTMQYYKFSTKK